MHSRVTSVEIDTMRMGVDEALAAFRDEVVPRLRDEQGYQGVLALATPEGRGLLISFWEAEEQARRGVDERGGVWNEEIARFITIFRSPPGREEYQVAFAEVPALAGG